MQQDDTNQMKICIWSLGVCSLVNTICEKLGKRPHYKGSPTGVRFDVS
jgi:hypothetical protein